MTESEQASRLRRANRVSRVVIAANLGLALLKAIVGLIGNSTALVSDAVHSASDVLSTVAVLLALHFSHIPPDEDHHYGHQRVESLATKAISIFLIAAAVLIIRGAYRSLTGDALLIPSGLALAAAGLSAAVKEVLYRYALGHGRAIQSQALMADAWHQRSDALSSLGVLVGIAGARLGFAFLDPVAALVVAAMILRMGVLYYWRAENELLDAAPEESVLDEIFLVASQVQGVENIDELRARQHGGRILVDLEIRVKGNLSAAGAHAIAHRVEKAILGECRRVAEVLVHVNPAQSE